MLKRLSILVLVLFLLLIVSCDSSQQSEGGSSQSVNFTSIDLSGAEGLFMKSSGGSRGLEDLEEQDLLKIVGDEAQPVALRNESGSVVSFWGNPTSIIRLNDRYFVLTFKKTTTIQPPYILVSVKEGIIICLNHEGEYNHACIEDAISTKFINATEDGDYIYWVAPHMGADNFLDGTSMKRYKKGTSGTIEIVKFTTDHQRYMLAVGKTSLGKDVGMMYSTNFTYNDSEGNPPEELHYIGYIMVDGEEERSFDFGEKIEFSFFFNDKFYLLCSGGLKSVDLDGNISESPVFSDADIKYCTDYVEVDDTCLLYDKEQHVNKAYLIKDDGSGGISVMELAAGLDHISEVQAGDGYYYFCGDCGDSTVLKSFSTTGGFSVISNTSDFVVSSFYKDDDYSFVFIGKDASDKSVWGQIDEMHGFHQLESSTEEYSCLTRITQDE